MSYFVRSYAAREGQISVSIKDLRPVTTPAEKVVVGVNTVSALGYEGVSEGGWESYQLPLLKRGALTLAKVQVPKGFSTNPSHVEDLIKAGASTVILRTQDCRITVQEVTFSLVDRGFEALFPRYPHVNFWIEVGNETDICGMSAEQNRVNLLTVVRACKPMFARHPNVKWMASLPVNLPNQRIVYIDGEVDKAYDAWGIHIYGDYDLNDRQGVDNLTALIGATTKPIYVTEMGINHGPMPRAEKATKYLAFTRVAHERVKGIAIWTVSANPNWANYALDAAAMDVLAARFPDRQWFPETGFHVDGAFLHYWQRAGLDLGDPGVSYRESLALFGYPISRAFVDPKTGLVTQWFERAAFEFHPTLTNTPYVVQLKRLGAELIV